MQQCSPILQWALELFFFCEWVLEFLLACQIFVFAIVQVRANKVLRYEQETSSEQPQTSIAEPRQNRFHVKCMCMPIYKKAILFLWPREDNIVDPCLLPIRLPPSFLGLEPCHFYLCNGSLQILPS